MNTELAIVLGLLCAAIVMFAMNKPRMDMVALIMMIALPFTGVISMGESLAGFADSNIVLIAALFVIGEGFVRTGVARMVGDLIIARTGNSEVRVIVMLMVSVCLLGSLMSSTAVTAIFIPIAFRIAYSTGCSPGQLMMPLSMAALISGMITLVATAPNLVISSELQRQGFEGFGFFEITPFGVPVLVLAIAYMLFARRWLPGAKKSADAGRAVARPSLKDWIRMYNLASREHRLRIPAGSPLVGKALSELDLRGSTGVNILAIERARRFGRNLLNPTRETVLQANDILLIDLLQSCPSVEGVRERFGLVSLPLGGAYFDDRSQDIGMAQVIVPAESRLVGKSVVEAGFRTRTGLTVIGLRRGADAFSEEFVSEKIRVGDTLLVVGPWKQIERVKLDDTGVILMQMPSDVEEVLPAPGKAPHALFALGVVVVLMITGVIPNVQAALIGCLIMGATGCIGINGSYSAINWKTIVLIVGMLPFSLALQRTGGVELAAAGLTGLTGGAGQHVVLATLFALTMVLSMFMSNTATAVLLAPVAIAVAVEMGVSPYPFAMIVALAASTAFVTPVSSPVNTLVVTPGNYKFSDFVRIGGPFAVITMIVSVILVPIVMPLAPLAGEAVDAALVEPAPEATAAPASEPADPSPERSGP
ncbi:MAG: SLC13 family permease [Phycisphaerales bacterium]|nr:SLC13 family permease [Phycisphaerales bacterium]